MPSPRNRGATRFQHHKKVRHKNPQAVALGSKGGAKGGPARAATLTKEERSAIARQGGIARHKGN